MKSIVVYYSLSGHSQKIALAKVKETGADIFELKDAKKHGKIWAFSVGAFKALRRKKTNIQDISIDFSSYDKIICIMPIWAGVPAPAFNNLAEVLPKDRIIELLLTSDSGKSNEKKTKEFLVNKGIQLASYIDIKNKG